MVLDVLFVSCEGRLGGAERSLLSLASALRHHESVAIACPQGSLLEKTADAWGVEAIGLPLSPAQPTPAGALGTIVGARSLRHVVQARQPRLVHANSIYSLPVALGATYGTGTPVIGHLRDICRRRLGAWLYGKCTATIAISRYVAESSPVFGLRNSRITVVHNGIDPVEPAVPEARGEPAGEPQPPRDRFVYANIGQFVPWKRQDHFISAAEAHGGLGDAEYWIVGDDITGRCERYKQSVTMRAGQARPQVRLLGWQENMSPVWNRVDCLVHTAATEPFGRVIVEAMARRIPIIAMNTGGPAEILEHEDTGLLVDPHDGTALVEAMRRVQSDAALRERLTANAYRVWQTKYTVAQKAEGVLRVHQEVLSGTCSPMAV